MKSIRFYLIAALLAAFGFLTVFMSGSVIFDLFGMRAREGNYVPFVVWANFFSGVAFLASAFGYVKSRPWAARPLVFSFGLLLAAFVGLFIHIAAGAPYETKTVFAMIFRITVNGVFIWVVRRHVKTDPAALVKGSMALVIPLALLAGACGHAGKEDSHGHEGAQTPHHHAAEDLGLKLNNGAKWEADEHTRHAVAGMKQTVASFEQSREQDYHVLADSLTRELNTLIAGCTMKGPAHDELHKWLVPLTENIKGLAAEPDAEKAGARVTRITGSLNEFGDYFE